MGIYHERPRIKTTHEAGCAKPQDGLGRLCDALREIYCLKTENERLRHELELAYDPQRIGGQADPDSFAYAIDQLREFRWQHATNDEDAIPYINKVARAHARENAQLRAKNASLTHRNARLIWLARAMYRTEQRVLDEADDTVWCGSSETLRDAMDAQMSVMKDLGCQPDDYDMRARELGWTVVK